MVSLSSILERDSHKSERVLLLDAVDVVRRRTPNTVSQKKRFIGLCAKRVDRKKDVTSHNAQDDEILDVDDDLPGPQTMERRTPIIASGWSRDSDLRFSSRFSNRWRGWGSHWSPEFESKNQHFPRARGRAKLCHEWCSTPPPPPDLWDVEESEFLDKVSCIAVARLVSIDHKEGTWGVRLMCDWQLRTLNTHDRTETNLRVPGIRMPAHRVSVEESRIWRDFDNSTDLTVCWRGISIFNICGHEIFEMHDFPFDRQLINLELLEFVWRPRKDAATYDFGMRLVHFKLTTTSMLPTWTPYPAIVTVEELKTSRDHIFRLSTASRFLVHLKVERQPKFYLIQFFSVTCLITAVAIFPLALPPTESYADKRLAAYALGLLTLVGFKYSMSDQLPKAPYMTFADCMLLYQIGTILIVAVEDLFAFRLVNFYASLEGPINSIEVVMLFVLIIGWTILLLYVAKFKKGKAWDQVIAEQHINNQAQLDNDDGDPEWV